MLVTLLLCNAGAMETLPIFLDKMLTPVEAVIISVSLVLIFGEIIPQALCTGPKQLAIAYWCCPIVYGLMWLTILVSWPIGWLLDKLLGEHKFQRYDNDQLKKLVMLHSIQALKKVEEHLPEGIDGLTAEQAKMVEGAITFQAVPCEEVMTKIGKVTFTLTMETVLTAKALNDIRENGFSRIPICKDGNRNQIVAFLLTKSLVGIDTNNKTVQ